MTRCNFKVYVKRINMGAFYSENGFITEFQCANEPNHSGDHLIVVPR